MGKETAVDARKDISYSAVTNGTGNEKLHLEDFGPVPTIGARHWQCLWYFLLIFFGYGVRVTMSVAIVAMTDPSASENSDILTYPEWTQKGAILSAFFWGYIWPQVLAGYVANRFGAKWFLISTMGIQSLLMVFIPYIAAHFGQIGMMAVRATQGFCQGFFFPIVVHLLSQWVPQEERATLSNIAFGSVPCGTVVGLLITGIIAAGPFGWPMVFYLYGGAGLVWCLLFSFFGYDSPSEHPNINKTEKYFIQNSLGHTDEKPSHKVPWIAIFTSVPVWALLIAQCGWIFGFWILLSQIPTYMSHVMNFNIKDNSILSSLPYLVQLILSLLLSFISDFIINKKFIGQTDARKLFNTIGAFIPAIALIWLAYTRSDQPNQAVVLLIVAIGISAAGMSVGWGINCLDLTSTHSGTIMGICNAVANVFSILAPLIVQLLVTDQRNPHQWKIIFFLAAAVNIGTAIVFILFGSAENQPWNDEHDNKEDKEKQKLYK